MSNIPMKSAIDLPADKFISSDDYSMTSYIKTALWLFCLKMSVGRDKMDKAFQFISASGTVNILSPKT